MVPHGTPWYPMVLHGTPWYSMVLRAWHGTTVRVYEHICILFLISFSDISGMGVKNFMKTAWGSDKSRTFRVGSWVFAIVAFGIWNNFDQAKPVVKQVKPMAKSKS